MTNGILRDKRVFHADSQFFQQMESQSGLLCRWIASQVDGCASTIRVGIYRCLEFRRP
jgi:hypothetical protein